MLNVSPYTLSVWNGSAWVPLSTPGAAFGSGTPSFIAKWSTSTTLGDFGGATCPGTTHIAFINPDGTVGCTDVAPAGNASGTFLVSGGAVTWLTGYTFRVGAANYYINGVYYESLQQDITLAASDPTNDRIDTIALDTSLAAVAITGTPAAPPFEPQTDPATQLRLTAVTVVAASTQPTVTTTMIYDEGVEWAATSSTVRIVVDSTNNPNVGTKSIEGTAAVLNDQVTFVKPSGTTELSAQNFFIFNIRVNGSWSTNKRIRLVWRIGATQVGQFIDVRNGQYGFNSSLTGTYQQIAVPASSFAVPVGIGIDQLVMRIVGGGPAVSFNWDRIQLQSGLPSQGGTSVPGGLNGSVQYNNAGTFDGFGSWDGSQLRIPGQVVIDGRTGTPATFATFSVGGRLVQGAPYTTPGSVTSFSAGDLSPLFTSSVATATTTPALTFTLATAADKTIFSNISGGVAAPSFNTSSSVFDSQLGSTRGSVAIRGVASWSAVPPGTSGHVLTSQGAGSDPTWVAPSAGGVTSVAMTVPSFLSVTGSPITTTGTLALALTTQTANTVLAGPTSGGVAVPTFRSLVLGDLPAGVGTVTSIGTTAPLTGGTITGTGTIGITVATCADTGGQHLNFASGAFTCGTSSLPATAQTRRVCAMVVGADNGTALVAADLGPQGRQCFIPFAATIVEVTVAADAGTPNVIVRKNTAGSTSNILSSALATASSGGIACSNTGGTTGLDGATTCSATLQNTSISAGAFLELVSGAASTAKRMSIFVTYTVN
jgi:hypothetical protein